jgi:ribosomal protein L40E
MPNLLKDATKCFKCEKDPAAGEKLRRCGAGMLRGYS